VEILDSARKHGVEDYDMLHAFRNHIRAFQTSDPEVTMYLGPSQSGVFLEVGVVSDDEGEAIIHAMQARAKFLERKGGT
jgi:hypothetical protein